MNTLWATFIADLMGIDWQHVAEERLVAFVQGEVKKRVQAHVPAAAAGAAKDGWTYASTTPDRPTAPHALIGDLIYRLEKGTVPGGGVRDFIRDRVEPKVSALVAPQITPDTPLPQVAQLVADTALAVVF